MSPAFQYAPTIWPQVAGAVVTALLAAYVWPRRGVAGATPYFILLVVFACASLLLALSITAVALPLKLAFRQAWAICMLIEAWATLALVLDYTSRAHTVPAWGWALIVFPLIVAAGFVVTAQWHTLFWTRVWFDGSLHMEDGIARTLSMAYVYALGIAALVVLVAVFARSRGVFRWQAGFLIAGISLTWLGESSDLFRGDLLRAVDVLVICSILGKLVLALALFRFRTFDLVPIARDWLVEGMIDGMLVLDAQGRVVDLNPAACWLLAPLPAKPIGRRMEDALHNWPELLSALHGPPATHATISHDAEPGAGVYALGISPLADSHGQPAGRLITWHDVTILHQHQEEVTQQRQALATLAERDRLGKELHDGLGQTLGFVHMEAQAGRDALGRGQVDLADSYLARIASVAQEAQEDVRDLLLAVRAAAGAPGRGFFEGLEDYLARYRRVHPIQVELDRPTTLTDEALEPAVQVQLLRIIQESLANVRRHAGATVVRITFAHEGARVRVAIEDDGQGFDPVTVQNRKAGHYGLRFMRERAEEVGGALEIQTALGRSVKLIVQVPARQSEHRICSEKGTV